MGQVPIYVRFTKSGNLYIGTYFTTSNSIAARLLPITKKTVKDHLVKMDVGGMQKEPSTYLDRKILISLTDMYLIRKLWNTIKILWIG